MYMLMQEIPKSGRRNIFSNENRSSLFCCHVLFLAYYCNRWFNVDFSTFILLMFFLLVFNQLVTEVEKGCRAENFLYDFFLIFENFDFFLEF